MTGAKFPKEKSFTDTQKTNKNYLHGGGKGKHITVKPIHSSLLRTESKIKFY